MTEWTHPQCEACWIAAHGVIRDDGSVELCRPTLLREPVLEVCCSCGKFTIFGLYVRADGRNLLCGGDHGTEDR